MALLKWIADKDLMLAVSDLLTKAQKAQNKAATEFGKNVIDPFSAVFQIAGFGMDDKAWRKSETARQAEKSLQNHIGHFHQKILGSVKGWDDMKAGGVIDLKCDKKKIVAEIKNKHNTISGGKLASEYDALAEVIMPKHSKFKGYTAYLVRIIPNRPARFDKEFTPSNKGSGALRPSNKQIRTIDGASFYALVTGRKDALKELFDILPRVIYICSKKTISSNTTKMLNVFFDDAFKD